MEIRELARLVVCLVALLKSNRTIGGSADPGDQSLEREVDALTQLYSERLRILLTPAYQDSVRGAKVLERAETAPANPLER